ncbi:hypothetical protein QAD02_009684 [Eretmocerus hayati]|uniref:Uncharacterized protein n=1 Tax=Eretmocerus hayati TaxID=131215 RepID=A0ACC2NBF5_9HYME|nr:hypothetical protein QAD02_009684 [Eretmocerus hayati]
MALLHCRNNYRDILSKLEKLKVSETALTQSSGEDPDELSRREIENLRREALMAQANEFSKQLSFPGSKSKHQNPTDSKDTTTTSSTVGVNTQVLPKHEHKDHTKKSTHTLIERTAVLKKYPGPSTKMQRALTLNSVELSKSHQSSTVNTENIIEEPRHNESQMHKTSKKNSCSQGRHVEQKKQEFNEFIPPEPVDNVDSYLSNLLHSKSDLVPQDALLPLIQQVLTEVKSMKGSLVKLAAEFHKEMENLKAMIIKISVGEHVPTNFIDDKEKLSKGFDFNIPFRRSEYFEKFDAKLASNEELVTLVTSLLKPEVDPKSIPKTFKHMIQMFMTKRAASRWTASQKKPKKKVFKKTNFYKIARGLVKKSKAQRNEPSVKDTEYRTALSSVLTNVHGWKDEDAESCNESSSEYSSTSEENPSRTSSDSEDKDELFMNEPQPESEGSKNGSGDSEIEADSAPILNQNPEQIPITNDFPNDFFNNYNFSENDSNDGVDETFDV